MCPTCLAGQLSSPVRLPRSALQTHLLIFAFSSCSLPQQQGNSSWSLCVCLRTRLNFVGRRENFYILLFLQRQVNSRMRIPQKVNAVFWCSIDSELQRRSDSTGFILRMWPKCSLLKKWIVALNFPCTLIATASHLRQDSGDDPLFWRSLLFNESYFSPFHLSISLECWGFGGSSVWACNCQRPLLTVPVFCMWKDLEATTWALN